MVKNKQTKSSTKNNKVSLIRPRSWLSWRVAINSVIFIGLVYIIASQWRQFDGSLKAIETANFGFIFIGLFFIFSTYFLAALQYKFLAQKPIKYMQTVTVQLAGALANRILPAGIGGIGLNADYLHRRKHSLSAAGVVAGTNNLIGIIMHISLIGLIIILGGSVLDFKAQQFPSWLIAVISGFILLLVVMIVIFPRIRRWFKIVFKEVGNSIRYYSKHGWRLVAAALIALLVSVCFISGLDFAAAALGHDSLSFSQAAIIMTLGVLVGTATPTPGGVIGAEAGLAAGLIAYGFSSADAIAVAILYRLMSFWLPLLIGGVAFIVAQKRKYI